MGRGSKKAPSTSFSPVTFRNVGISPKSILNFSFTPFSALVQNFRVMPSVSPELLNLNHERPSKNWFLCSNPYKIEVMITSLIEMLGLPNFGHTATTTV